MDTRSQSCRHRAGADEASAIRVKGGREELGPSPATLERPPTSGHGRNLPLRRVKPRPSGKAPRGVASRSLWAASTHPVSTASVRDRLIAAGFEVEGETAQGRITLRDRDGRARGAFPSKKGGHAPAPRCAPAFSSHRSVWTVSPAAAQDPGPTRQQPGGGGHSRSRAEGPTHPAGNQGRALEALVGQRLGKPPLPLLVPLPSPSRPCSNAGVPGPRTGKQDGTRRPRAHFGRFVSLQDRATLRTDQGQRASVLTASSVRDAVGA